MNCCTGLTVNSAKCWCLLRLHSLLSLDVIGCSSWGENCLFKSQFLWPDQVIAQRKTLLNERESFFASLHWGRPLLAVWNIHQFGDPLDSHNWHNLKGREAAVGVNITDAVLSKSQEENMVQILLQINATNLVSRCCLGEERQMSKSTVAPLLISGE